MKKSALIIAVGIFALFGCKSGEKHEMIFDEPMESVKPKPDGSTSKTSLDWAGIYEGTTPSSDGEGIKTVVELKTDKTFKMSQSQLGKSIAQKKFTEAGDFTWDEDGQSIILKASDITIRFQVGETELTLLDMSGNVKSGALSNFYILKKK